MAKPRLAIPDQYSKWMKNYLETKGWLKDDLELKDYINTLSTKEWRLLRYAFEQMKHKEGIQEQLKELKTLKSSAKAVYTKHN